MPNWTTNAVAVRQEDLGRFVKDGIVDFNLLRPMPEPLLITSGSIEHRAVAAATGTPEEELNMRYPYRNDPDMGSHLPFDVENFEDLRRLGEVYIENERKYGSRTWYDWCCSNWGTKWNACSSHIDEYVDIAILVFDTAWAPPSKEMFDEAGVPYYAESFDEDYSGIYTWNGTGGGLIFKNVRESDDEFEWDTGEYDPDIPELKERLAISLAR